VVSPILLFSGLPLISFRNIFARALLAKMMREKRSPDLAIIAWFSEILNKILCCFEFTEMPLGSTQSQCAHPGP
jgi:hypothetical protein